MNTQPFFIGRVTDPVVAHMLHMSTLDVFLVNKFLREQIKNNTVLANDAVVLIADQHLNAKPPILRLLKKNIEITGLTIAGVYGDQGALWAETLNIPFFTGKPRMVPDAEALKMRTAILQQMVEDSENNLQVVTDIVGDSLDRIEQAEELEQQRQYLKTFTPEDNSPVEEPIVPTTSNAQEIINFLRKSLDEKRGLHPTSHQVDAPVDIELSQDTNGLIEQPISNVAVEQSFDEANTSHIEHSPEHWVLVGDEDTTDAAQIGLTDAVVEDIVVNTDTTDYVEAVAVDTLECVNPSDAIAVSQNDNSLNVLATDAQQLNFDFVFPIHPQHVVENENVDAVVSLIETELDTHPEPANTDLNAVQEDERASLDTTIGICKLLNIQTKVVKAQRKQTTQATQQLMEVKAAPPLRLGGRVRSGCRLQNSGDVIVEGAAHPGSEIIAGGDIHIYGTGGGRLMAGVDGDKNACIYINTFDAEIISIAGHYYVMEDHDSYWSGRSVKISLVNEMLAFEEIFVAQKTA